jgi:hypothetical protein
MEGYLFILAFISIKILFQIQILSHTACGINRDLDLIAENDALEKNICSHFQDCAHYFCIGLMESVNFGPLT